MNFVMNRARLLQKVTRSFVRDLDFKNHNMNKAMARSLPLTCPPPYSLVWQVYLNAALTHVKQYCVFEEFSPTITNHVIYYFWLRSSIKTYNSWLFLLNNISIIVGFLRQFQLTLQKYRKRIYFLYRNCSNNQ